MGEGSARPERVRYRFSPLERRGVVAGWRGGQIAAVAVSLAIGVMSVRSSPSVAGILASLVAIGVGGAFAFWPVQGRTGEQWLPLGMRWVRILAAGRRQCAPAPWSGRRVSLDPALTGPGGITVGPPAGPGHSTARRTVFGGLTLEGIPTGHRETPSEVGVVFDAPSRTATAVLALRGHSFALLGPADQDARLAAWARVLAAMAREGSDVYRIQWLESCLPDDGGSVRRHWSTHAAFGPDSAAGRSYRALVDESSPVTRHHRVLLSLSIHTRRSSRSIRSAGRGAAGIAIVLSREVLALHRALGGADISVEGVLGPRALARLIRETYAPAGVTAEPPPSARSNHSPISAVADRTNADVGTDAGTPGGATEAVDTVAADDRSTLGERSGVAWPWPMAVDPHWDAVHTDATWHTTYWIAEWPRVDVTPDFLGPVLFSSLRRTVVMVMEPVSPSRAARQVAQARTADIADGELRRRGGFLVTARHTREKEGVEERDGELADGHAQYRFSGYVTVTADSRAELEAARAALEQAAGQARIELRLLFGEQDTAFPCSLPVGRGLS